MSSTDQEIIRRYSCRHAEDDFAEIVRRHLNLVYSAAMRQVRSPQLAEEITQSVFIDLSRNIKQLKEDTILAAWLYRVTCRTSIDMIRQECRRKSREQISHEINAMNATDTDWKQIEPVLDEAMQSLDDNDRSAVLLRYFENKSLREVGLELGTSEDAAQKRISRALERLRDFFSKQGIPIGTSGLAVAITANAAQPAPVGLCSSILVATKPQLLSLCAMTTTQTKLIGAGIFALLAVSLGLLWRENSSLNRQLTELRQQVRTQSAEIQSAGKTKSAGDAPQDRQKSRLEYLELLSLRGRVTQLNEELRQLKGIVSASNAQANISSENSGQDSILFSATLTNRVNNGNTLVVGGWSQNRLRGYLLVRPVIQPLDSADSSLKVDLHSQVIGAPQSFWNQIGWGAARSETRRSSLATVISPEQRDTLLEALKAAEGGEVSNGSRMAVSDGSLSKITFVQDDGTKAGVLMGIDVVSHIHSNGPWVDLELRPSAITSNTTVHSSLKATP